MITQKRLKKILSYNPKTGIFVWRERYSNRIKIGDIAGGLHEGYSRISIDGIRYKSHRLAWLYVYGYLPKQNIDIDHINHIADDNRIANLRLATRSQNAFNRLIINRGVHQHKETKKWHVHIGKDYKNYYIGSFKTYAEAREARKTAEERLFGIFAAPWEERVAGAFTE